MPNRQIQDANNYRYAYQGQEKDPETGKEAFQLRLWDGRIGRWLTTDPYGQYFSPYMAMGNNPISRIDPDGGSDHGADDCCPNTTGVQQLDEIVITATHKGAKGNVILSAISSTVGTTADKRWFAKYPEHETPIRASANRAGLMEFFAAGTSGNNDGYGDGLRHSYWSFLIARELGAKVAKGFTDNHENIIGLDNLNSPRGLMDLHNNQWGISQASRNDISILNPFNHIYEQAVLDGKIIIIRKNTIPKDLNERRAKRESALTWASHYGERE